MDFSMSQALHTLLALAIVTMCIFAFSVVLSMFSNMSEKTTETKNGSNFVDQEVNKPIEGSKNPTLYINKNIKIKSEKFLNKTTISEITSVIKQESACRAFDYKGNRLGDNNITLKIQNSQQETIFNYIKKGGILEVKYSVFDSQGRKTAIIKNVIISTH